MAIILDGTSGMTLPGANTSVQLGSLTRSTAQTASSTSVDFTNIPSWVKRITVMVNGISTNGTSSITLRPGGATGFVTTGYTSAIAYPTSTTTAVSGDTTGFYICAATAAMVASGSATLTNVTGNIWAWSGVFVTTTNTYTMAMVAGSVNIGETLTQLRITTFNGTQVFDAGTVNIMYE